VLDQFPSARWTWTTLRADARVSLTFDQGPLDDSLKPVAITVERIDGQAVRSRDLLDVAEAFDTIRSAKGEVTQLGLVDELTQHQREMRSRSTEREFSVDDLEGLSEEDKAWAREQGINKVSTYESPHPEQVSVQVRSARQRKRVRLTDEVLEDVAAIVREYGEQRYTQVLMERYGWTQEHAWRVKGRAVKAGKLPPIEDGRGRQARQNKRGGKR